MANNDTQPTLPSNLSTVTADFEARLAEIAALVREQEHASALVAQHQTSLAEAQARLRDVKARLSAALGGRPTPPPPITELRLSSGRTLQLADVPAKGVSVASRCREALVRNPKGLTFTQLRAEAGITDAEAGAARSYVKNGQERGHVAYAKKTGLYTAK